MAICKHCQEPIGMIHRCKPTVASKAPKRDAEDVARTALMMADAGYHIDPVELLLAKGLLEMRKLLKDYIAGVAAHEGVYYRPIDDHRAPQIEKIIEELKDEDDIMHGRKKR